MKSMYYKLLYLLCFAFSLMKNLTRRIVCTVCCLFAVQAALASDVVSDLPKAKHMGVASCASSVCHGRIAPNATSNVQQNEYKIWLNNDRHSQSYKTLLGKRARKIAENLNLGVAHKASECLQCHADNVDKNLRGNRFKLSDGVGCESCHGGSEYWLKNHSHINSQHSNNLHNGMYPIENPKKRAQLCLDCHMGSGNNMAGHRLMSAGHPRLRFELEVYTALQPAHYQRDDDYYRRKQNAVGVHQWAIGLQQASIRMLDMVDEKIISSVAGMPDFAFFECHACHHSYENVRWSPTRFERNLPPGHVRLNDGALQILHTLLKHLKLNEAVTLKHAIVKWHNSSVTSVSALRSASADLRKVLVKLDDLLVAWDASVASMSDLRKDLLANLAKGEYRDYTSAEQAFMALEMLSIEMGDRAKLAPEFEALFEALADEYTFESAVIERAAKKFGTRVAY